MDELLNVKFIHPTNNIDMDIEVPESLTPREVFAQLVEAKFLTPGQPYEGVLKPTGTASVGTTLDNNKSMKDNEVLNNSTVQITTATPAGNQ